MNKKQLAMTLAGNTGISQVKSLEIVNEIFNANNGIIAAELNNGGKVTIPGFGTFGTKTRAARIGTNPSTGAKINIAAKDFAFWKPGKNLKDSIAQ